ncbi:MAG: AAA-like domain-containing protein, partial [Candidatus Tectomicrobia bacterium]
MKRALERHADENVRVIPIILRPCDWENQPFAQLQVLPTDGRPVTQWRNRDQVLAEIARVIRTVVEELRQSMTLAEPTSAPESQAPMGLETGAMPPDSPFYILRSADHEALQQLSSFDATIVVKGSRKSGKSSLLHRLHARARDDGQRSCYIDFQSIDSSCFANLEGLLRELAYIIAEELGLPTGPDERWSERRSPTRNLTAFLDQAILAAADTSLQLLFDEADRAFGFPSSCTDLFAMIRSWHNRRANEPHWRKLQLVIAHSTDPTLWIRDLNQSPFNVGRAIMLADFDQAQIEALNRTYGQPLKHEDDMSRLVDLTGGHPYLTRLALYTLATQPSSLADLEHTAAREDSLFASHLRQYVRLLLDDAELKTALLQVIHD